MFQTVRLEDSCSSLLHYVWCFSSRMTTCSLYCCYSAHTSALTQPQKNTWKIWNVGMINKVQVRDSDVFLWVAWWPSCSAAPDRFGGTEHLKTIYSSLIFITYSAWTASQETLGSCFSGWSLLSEMSLCSLVTCRRWAERSCWQMNPPKNVGGEAEGERRLLVLIWGLQVLPAARRLSERRCCSTLHRVSERLYCV